MFDSGLDLGVVSTSALAGLIEQNHAELVASECRTLVLAAVWADRHYLDPSGLEYHPLVERACAFGGEGTPEVSEYCAAELGALQGTHVGGAVLRHFRGSLTPERTSPLHQRVILQAGRIQIVPIRSHRRQHQRPRSNAANSAWFCSINPARSRGASHTQIQPQIEHTFSLKEATDTHRPAQSGPVH